MMMCYPCRQYRQTCVSVHPRAVLSRSVRGTLGTLVLLLWSMGLGRLIAGREGRIEKQLKDSVG